MKLKRIAVVTLGLILAFVGVVHFGPPSVKYVTIPAVHAQGQAGWIGATQVPGFFSGAVNGFPAGATAATAGTVTNPASNFLLQVDGGPVYCGGQSEVIAESNIQLAASNTYMIVYNCASSTMYAKTAVTAPGTPTTTPGVPATLLFPTSSEINLATVVCNATACGNGGNGSITDNRVASAFPQGLQIAKVAFGSLPSTAPDGAMILVTGTTHPATPGVTCVAGAVIALAVRESGAWACY